MLALDTDPVECPTFFFRKFFYFNDNKNMQDWEFALLLCAHSLKIAHFKEQL